MDGSRFDQFAKGVATRRGTVRGLAGVLTLGLAAGLPEVGDAKKHKKHCPAGETRCPATTATSGKHAKKSKPAKHNKQKVCVDLQTDAQHCGACATACGA